MILPAPPPRSAEYCMKDMGSDITYVMLTLSKPPNTRFVIGDRRLAPPRVFLISQRMTPEQNVMLSVRPRCAQFDAPPPPPPRKQRPSGV